MQAFAPYIPIDKSRGFTAQYDKRGIPMTTNQRFEWDEEEEYFNGYDL